MTSSACSLLVTTRPSSASDARVSSRTDAGTRSSAPRSPVDAALRDESAGRLRARLEARERKRHARAVFVRGRAAARVARPSTTRRALVARERERDAIVTELRCALSCAASISPCSSGGSLRRRSRSAARPGPFRRAASTRRSASVSTTEPAAWRGTETAPVRCPAACCDTAHAPRSDGSGAASTGPPRTRATDHRSRTTRRTRRATRTPTARSTCPARPRRASSLVERRATNARRTRVHSTACRQGVWRGSRGDWRWRRARSQRRRQMRRPSAMRRPRRSSDR